MPRTTMPVDEAISWLPPAYTIPEQRAEVALKATDSAVNVVPENESGEPSGMVEPGLADVRAGRLATHEEGVS